MSGGEPSSIKRSTGCAARLPVPSKVSGCRVGVTFDGKVYGLGLCLQDEQRKPAADLFPDSRAGIFFRSRYRSALDPIGRKCSDASGVISKMASADL